MSGSDIVLWVLTALGLLMVALIGGGVWVYRRIHPQKRPPRVFISCVHEDAAIAECIKALLVSELEQDVFLALDNEHIPGGTPWLQALRVQLQACDIVVLLLSRRAIGRQWVHFEAGAAWGQETLVIPCCFGNHKTSDLRPPYSDWHAVDLEADPSFLVESVHHALALRTPYRKLKDRLWLGKEQFKALALELRKFADDPRPADALDSTPSPPARASDGLDVGTTPSLPAQ